ncbi:MAG: SPOR domain-containing protein [Acidobacteria bacterium]|nr:SPOR domain-containing protein [Acidobacteriota bacterium]
MSKRDQQQTELVLENRQVVAIFLGLALLCGIFFALGYVVGRNTASPPTTLAQTDENVPQASEKPSAMSAPSYIPRNPAAAAQALDETPAATDLNFYSSVQDDQPQGMVPPADSSAPVAEAPVALTVVPPPPGILVQVSALTRREDAASLVALLSERNLPVLVTSGENDALFHVVVGPYKSAAEAQKTKQLLEQDGFRPFIRR